MPKNTLPPRTMHSSRGLIPKPPGLCDDPSGGFRWKPSAKYRKLELGSVLLKRADGSVITDLHEALPVYERLITSIEAGLKVSTDTNSERTFDALVALFRAKIFDHEDAEYSDSYRRDQNRYLPMLCDESMFGGLTMDELDRDLMIERLRIAQKKHGVHQGFKLFGTARQLMGFAVEKKWIAAPNPLAESKGKRPDKIKKPQGRIAIWTLDEIVGFIKLAQFLGLPSQAHFIVLAVCTGQSVTDILEMPRLGEPLLSDRGGFWPHFRAKTTNPAFMPASKLARRHVNQMHREQEALFPGQVFSDQLIYERTGRPYTYNKWQDINKAIRDLLAGDLEAYNANPLTERANPNAHQKAHRTAVLPKIASLADLPVTPVPSIATKKPMDLRDTAISRIIRKTGSELIPTLTAGHSSSKVTVKQDMNDMIRSHYWEKDGEPVLAALGAWDDIYDALYPSLHVIKKVS